MARILDFPPNWFSSPVSKEHHHLPFMQEAYKCFFYSCCFLFPHISHPIHYKSCRLNLQKYILIFFGVSLFLICLNHLGLSHWPLSNFAWIILVQKSSQRGLPLLSLSSAPSYSVPSLEATVGTYFLDIASQSWFMQALVNMHVLYIVLFFLNTCFHLPISWSSRYVSTYRISTSFQWLHHSLFNQAFLDEH